MLFHKDKRAVELSTLGGLILLFVGFFLVANIFLSNTAEAEDAALETSCRFTNQLHYGTKASLGPVKLSASPQVCKTLNLDEVPTKSYEDHPSGPAEGAKQEIRDKMGRCWWMWLNGEEKNMFDKEFYHVDNGCFICYTFTADKDTSFSYEELSRTLDSPYAATSASGIDNCASGGRGGKCMQECDQEGAAFSKETSSTLCPLNQKCCIDEDSRNECVNRGGICSTTPVEGMKAYPDWNCAGRGDVCYVSQENFVSYLDYIQGTNGAPGGPGLVLFGDNEGFQPGRKYAITFVSPGKEWDIDTLLGIGGSAGILAAGIGLGVATGGIGLIPLAAFLGGAGASAFYGIEESDVNEINYLMVSTLDTVAERCAIHAGAGQS